MIRFSYKLLFFFLSLFAFSCAENKPAQFPVRGTNALLIAQSRYAREGTLDFSNPKKLEYRFEEALFVLPNSSLDIEYEIIFPPSQTDYLKSRLILDTQEASWVLPMDESWQFYSYSVPVGASFNGYLGIALESSENFEKNASPVFKIKSIKFGERWFGFYAEDDILFSTPFIFNSNRSEDASGKSFVLDVNVQTADFFPHQSFAEIEAVISGIAVLEFAGRKIDVFSGAGKNIYIPPGMFPLAEYSSGRQAALYAGELESFKMTFRQTLDAFPIPVKADPALILECPKESWRRKDYEVFRWDSFPSLLIFDTADYAVQDRLFKRLAFFVEKAGYRGRLVTDAEVAELHGWNAHDYHPEDLANFFDTARRQHFPLLDEERELEKILLNEGIIRESEDRILGGSGGILSISRESPGYLRYRLMAHEGYHGLFFIDEDFRRFCGRRWDQLPAPAKRFITSYFDYMAYDTKNEYLLVNEFMAYILQQSVFQAGEYFGKTAPSRLETSWRSSALPPKDEETETWPSLAAAFTAEAIALSDYVNNRWRLSAGRIWGVKVN